LKVKRSVVNGLKERLKRLNASVAEVDGLDLWQRCTLGLTLVSNDAGRLEEAIQQARDVIDREYRAQIASFEWEVFPSELK
jgi:uncharacterized protein YlxP (DUF503 family)